MQQFHVGTCALHTINSIGCIRAFLLAQIIAGVLDRAHCRCRTLISLLHVVGNEVTPRAVGVPVCQVDV